MLAKLLEHEGQQVVCLPKELRFSGDEVSVEKRGDEVVLRPVAKRRFRTLNEVALYMRENFPQGADFPDIERPTADQVRDINLD